LAGAVSVIPVRYRADHQQTVALDLAEIRRGVRRE
jgi:hypothetical protein